MPSDDVLKDFYADEIARLTQERDVGWAEVARVASLVLRAEAERDALAGQVERLREALVLARGTLQTAHDHAGSSDAGRFVRDITRIEIERIRAALAEGA